jgi:hypothetical protein
MTDTSRQSPMKRDLPQVAGVARPQRELIHNEAVRIVCAALGLACVMLAMRIASIW